MTTEPGPVIGRGRASVIYDLGDGTVLRRQLAHGSRSVEPEGALMLLAERQGVPVPHVHVASGTDIRMDLIPGPTMLATLLQQPDQAPALGHELAALHRRLDHVHASTNSGTDNADNLALVHGDLHPGNVIMSPDGPVLLDWTNARWADRPLDVGLTWLVLACFEDPTGPPELEVGSEPRRRLLDAFLQVLDSPAVRAALPRAAEIRRTDPATTAYEIARIRTLIATVDQ